MKIWTDFPLAAGAGRGFKTAAMADDFRMERGEATRTQLEPLSALLRRVFPRATHLTPAYLSWNYLGNPDGRALVCNATAGGEIIGHVAALPLRARIDGEERAGLCLVNGGTLPQFRGRGIIRRLTNSLLIEGFLRDYEFCIAVGNARSTAPLLAPFREVVAFHLLGQLEARIGIGRPRRKPLPEHSSFERRWTEESLRWRLANPARRYSVNVDECGMRVTAPSGNIAVGVTLYNGPRVTGIGPCGRIARPVRLWIGLDGEIDWSRSRYLPVPQRFRPSPLNLVYRDLRNGREAWKPDPGRVLFRGIDFDAF